MTNLQEDANRRDGKRCFGHYPSHTPVVVCVIALCLIILIGNRFTHQTLSDLTWMDTAQTAFLLLALYAIKSAAMVFPLAVLQLAAGHLLPMWAALCVNLIGAVLVLTTPYWIGRKFGEKAIRKLAGEHPNVESILKRQEDHSWFLCFFLRIVSGLPGDVVTMYLGATNTPYIQNLTGGLIGVLPKVILITVLGSGIQDPSSPSFWASAIIVLLLSIISVILYRLYRRKMKENA